MKQQSSYRQKIAQRSMIYWMLLLPVVIYLALIVLPDLPSSPMLRDAFWAGKFETDTLEDVVFIGDSRVYRGIDPQVFTRYTKLRSRNFGFSSASPDSLLIEHAIKSLSFSGKKILVIAVSANAFMDGSVDNTHFKSVQSWSVPDKWIKQHVYPSISFFDHRSVSDIYKHFKGEAYFENYDIYSGFAASRRVPADSGSALNAYRKQFERTHYLQTAERNFKQYVIHLKLSGYHPVIIRVPCAQAMIELEDFATNNAIPRLMNELEEAGVSVIPYSSKNLTSYDGSHLDDTSAKAYSIRLSQDILKMMKQF